MIPLPDLVAYCDRRTSRTAFLDFPGAFNGLQYANNGCVTKIGAAVDAGLIPFQQAIAVGVDFLIVHHGMFWDLPHPPKRPLHPRILALKRGNCALYSSHLPLDAHPEIGNNALLARQLGLTPARRFLPLEGRSIGCIAPCALTRGALRRKLQARYPRMIAIEYGSARPRAVAFCSGSGRSAIPELRQARVDTLVTGELREEHFNAAQEQKLNLYVCGHYATETLAVRALAAELAKRFHLPWEFIATDNPF